MSRLVLAAFLVGAFLTSTTLARYCDGIPEGTLINWHDVALCNRFYACQHGVDHEWFCPPGQFFSQRNQQCEATCNVIDRRKWRNGLHIDLQKSSQIFLFAIHRAMVRRTARWNVYPNSSGWTGGLQPLLHVYGRSDAPAGLSARVLVLAAAADVRGWSVAVLEGSALYLIIRFL